LPEDAAARRAVKTREALVEGAMDSALALVMAGRVAPEMVKFSGSVAENSGAGTVIGSVTISSSGDSPIYGLRRKAQNPPKNSHLSGGN
ncbi:MAG: hypothetical protein HAW59_01405, partial [Betaproteobacteria bacterium]|nr:hypothetical protein [Betaproteobacteria bacterium]